MAVRQSPNTGLIVTLIVFVTAFIVCLVLAIMFYTKIEEHRTAAAAARTELEKFIEPARRNAAEMNQYAAAGQRMQPPRKIVSYLESELNRLKLITAGADMDIARIESELQSAGAAEGQNALEVIRQLKTERDSAQQQVAQLQEQIRTVESQIADLQKMRDRIDAAAQAQREQLLADLGKLRQDVESLDAGQKQALAAVSQRVEEARTGYEEERQKLDNQLRDRQRDLDDLRKRIALFEGSLKKETPSVPNPSVNVDGEIIGIPPEKSVVYINLGRKDHLVLGMTFEVFGAARGVEIEEGDDGRVLRRGKATIEVVSMADNSAVGRIVRSSFGQPIQVGDVIANLVYDKRRTFKFYVFGEFNLDGVGRPSLTDTQMVINLIEQWGGKVVKPEDRERELTALSAEAAREHTLPYDTDFLILGIEPEMPRTTGDQSDPAVIRQRQLALQQLESYRRLQQQAAALGVPILNQNRFLALIGYYQR